MKTKLLGITVTAALWLLAIAHANAFYNPQSGRWLNRDPIGENGGPNLQCIAVNDCLNRIDVLGLQCTVTISVRHFNVHEGEKNGNRKRFRDYQPEKGCGAGKLGFVGCGANGFNDHSNEAGWGIPGMPRNKLPYPAGDPINGPEYRGDFDGKGYDPNDYVEDVDTPRLLDEALAAAVKAAAKMCQDAKACCKEVAIKVECSDNLRKQELRYRSDVRNLVCGTERRVKCAR